MDSFEEKMEVYRKARLPKEAILERIEHDFGLEYKLKAQSMLLASEQKKENMRNNGLIKIFSVGVVIVIALVVLYFAFTPAVVSSDFVSSKCPGSEKISISGSVDFKQKITSALSLIESKSCPYLVFASKNAPLISSEDSASANLNLYSPLKHNMAPDYSGSDYFVAAAVIHEACHGFQAIENMALNEHDCALTQYNFLTSISAPQADIQKILALKNSPDYYFDANNSDVFSEWAKKLK